MWHSFVKSYCGRSKVSFSKIADFLKNRGNSERWEILLDAPLLLASWVHPGNTLMHYEKNCGLPKTIGAIFSGQFLKNTDFWEISQKYIHSGYNSCECRVVSATWRPIPVYYWVYGVRCAAGISSGKLHSGIRRHYPGMQNFSKIIIFEKFELSKKWNLRKSKIFPTNITSKCIRI